MLWSLRSLLIFCIKHPSKCTVCYVVCMLKCGYLHIYIYYILYSVFKTWLMHLEVYFSNTFWCRIHVIYFLLRKVWNLSFVLSLNSYFISVFTLVLFFNFFAKGSDVKHDQPCHNVTWFGNRTIASYF